MTKEEKLALIPEQYSIQIVAPAYVSIDDNITFDINRSQISEDEHSVYIKIRTTLIQLNKSTKTTKIHVR
jgi:hypothetical protein